MPAFAGMTIKVVARESGPRDVALIASAARVDIMMLSP